ncbi:MAG: serine--tRNA ligase [Angelakisella sp.]|nr:serine--tRNA ligase [Angelakisella sp.]
MLDMKLIRQNPQLVKDAMKSRNKDMDQLIDDLVAADAKLRELSSTTDNLKAEQNKTSKEIPMLKKQGVDTTEVMARMKELSDAIKENDQKIAELTEQVKLFLYEIPNIPNETVPKGKDEKDNVEVRRFGEPRKFEYEPKAHWDLGASLGILDPEMAAKVTGARFHFYKGLGARLERSIISFFMDTHAAHGYTEILPPYMASTASMTGTGQLPKFAEDMYKIEGQELYMIPTAEVPVTNMYRESIIDGSELPLRYTSYSACFRGEAGSAGRDTRGLIRQHQFNKVELVKYTRPEQSYDELEEMTAEAERVLQLLELPYRVVALSTGDMGFSAAKTYDIEVWMPSYGRYVEISSCSNCEDFQARRAAIRFKDGPKEKAQLVHTLNGSGVAVGRTTAAILENYQNDDGSITVPKALRPYMGCDVIRKD